MGCKFGVRRTQKNRQQWPPYHYEAVTYIPGKVFASVAMGGDTECVASLVISHLAEFELKFPKQTEGRAPTRPQSILNLSSIYPRPFIDCDFCHGNDSHKNKANLANSHSRGYFMRLAPLGTP